MSDRERHGAAEANGGHSVSSTGAIDVHAHLVPPSLLDAVRAGAAPGVTITDTGGGPVLSAGTDQLGPLRPGMSDPGIRLRWMGEHSITEQWISPWLDLFTWHRFSPDAARRWAALVNRSLAALAEHSDGRLRAVPYVNLADLLGEADRATAFAMIRAMRPPAVLVNTHPAGDRSLADPALEPAWAAIGELGVPVLLHPPVNGPSCAFTPPVLQNVAGRITDTTAAVTELMVSGLLDRVAVKLIVVHGGGFLPYQAFRLDGLVRAGLLDGTGATAPPSAVISRMLFDTVGLDGLSIEFLVRRVGARQVLLGSDAPFPIGDPDPVGTIRATGLPPDVQQQICGDNARALAWSPGDGDRDSELGPADGQEMIADGSA